MNPLFISHLVADFLLQPKWLVDLKLRRISGIIIHSLIHAAVISLILLPTTKILALAVLIITVTHAFIDQTKIILQRKGVQFDSLFFVDQMAHLLVITAVTSGLVQTQGFPAFWATQNGILVSALLFIFSFAMALQNLCLPGHACHPEHVEGCSTKTTRYAAISISFFIFLLMARLT